MGKKYNTHYRIHVYDMSDPYDDSKRAYLPALKIKGQQPPVAYPPDAKVFATERQAVEWAKGQWWQQLGLPDPHIDYEFGEKLGAYRAKRILETWGD